MSVPWAHATTIIQSPTVIVCARTLVHTQTQTQTHIHPTLTPTQTQTDRHRPQLTDCKTPRFCRPNDISMDTLTSTTLLASWPKPAALATVALTDGAASFFPCWREDDCRRKTTSVKNYQHAHLQKKKTKLQKHCTKAMNSLHENIQGAEIELASKIRRKTRTTALRTDSEENRGLQEFTPCLAKICI